MRVREDFFCQTEDAGAAVAARSGLNETGENQRERDEAAGWEAPVDEAEGAGAAGGGVG